MKLNTSVAIVGNTNTGFEGSSWTTKEQCLTFKLSMDFFFPKKQSLGKVQRVFPSPGLSCAKNGIKWFVCCTKCGDLN